MMAIFKREFKSYFISVTGFLFAAVLLLFGGIFATRFHFLGGHTSFEYTLQSCCTVFLLIIPILTMRSLAEDKRAKTDRLLYSLPLKLWQVIVGKYLAMLAVLAVPVLILALYPLILSAFGSVNLVSAYACLLAFFLLGAALIAVCLFLSTLTENQVVAAILGFGAVLFIYIISMVITMIPTSATVSFVCLLILGLIVALIGYYLTHNISITCAIGAVCMLPTAIVYWVNRSLFDGLLPSLLYKLALFNRFESFVYGIFDLSTLFVYLSVSLFFVALTVLAAEKRRWS